MERRRSSNAGHMIRAFEAGQRACFLLLSAVLFLTVIRVPGAVSLAWAAVAAISAAAPFEGLLMVAAFAPIGVAIGSLTGTPPWTEPLVVAFLAGAAGRAAIQRRPVSWSLPWAAVVL